MTAFYNLTSSRQYGTDTGPIPISEILAYCEYFNITGEEDRADMLYYISELDEEFLEYLKEKEKQHAK